MRRLVPFAILLAACGQDSAAPASAAVEAEARVERRRIALGLPQTPLRFERGMQQLHSLDSEEVLKRESSKDALTEQALRIENVFRRVRLETATRRARDARAFDRAAVDTVEAAAALAREPTRDAARRLLRTCTDCHIGFRETR